MKALIIGYGRAGKRHARLLEELGIKWRAYDPYMENLGNTRLFDETVSLESLSLRKHVAFDFAVICSPPALHLDHIHQCLAANLPVLCEKPLCSFGQLDLARQLPPDSPVMPCFNYQFHPEVAAIREARDRWLDSPAAWRFYSDQYRPALPEWGLVLDHLPHTLDMLLWFAGDREIKIRQAFLNSLPEHYDSCYVYGRVGDQTFSIADTVRFKPCEKQAYIAGPVGVVPVGFNPDMFTKMYDCFLSHLRAGTLPVSGLGLAEALRVQELLEEIGKGVGESD